MASKGRNGAVHQTVWLKAAPIKAWQALTQGKHLKRWFAVPETLELRQGGRWDFVGFPGKALLVSNGKKFAHTHTFSSNLKTYVETGSPMWETAFKGSKE